MIKSDLKDKLYQRLNVIYDMLPEGEGKEQLYMLIQEIHYDVWDGGM